MRTASTLRSMRADPSVSRYTSGAYARQNPAWHVEDSPWKAAQILALLHDHGIVPATVCEVGCGAGEILVRLADALGPKAQLWGYDVSPQAIALCRSKSTSRLRFVEGDPSSSPDTCFDIMLTIDVIEHVEDCFGFLRRLAPHGRLHVFHIPLEMHVSAVARVTPLLAARRAVGHIHYFSRETALALLAETGYEVIEARYTSGAIALAPRSIRTRFLRLPRQILFRVAPNLAARLLGGFSLLVLARPRSGG